MKSSRRVMVGLVAAGLLVGPGVGLAAADEQRSASSTRSAGVGGATVGSLSEDGGVLAIDQPDASVLVTPRTGTAQRADVEAVELAVSGDGSTTIAITAAGAVVEIDGSTVRTLDVGLDDGLADPHLSFDGRYLAFSAIDPTSNVRLAYRHDLALGTTISLPGSALAISEVWGIDRSGNRLLVARRALDGQVQLGVSDIAERTFIKVTVDPARVSAAALRPDGLRVTFISADGLVEGVAAGPQLYETDLENLIIREVSSPITLRADALVAASGTVVVQSAASNPAMLEIYDRARDITRLIPVAVDRPGLTASIEVEPVEVADDGSTVRVLIRHCPGTCTTLGAGFVVLTGHADPGSLVWDASDRPAVDQIRRLYLAATGRDADAAGSAHQLQALIEGATVRDVAAELLASGEGRARHGASPSVESLIESAHQTLFGRSPTSDERSAWRARAAEVTDPASLLVELANQPDALDVTQTSPAQSSDAGELIRTYRAVFGRFPDRAGFGYWSGLRSDGLNFDAMVTIFVASEEFRLRYGADPTDDELIELTYRNVLDRAPDEVGLAYWRDQLAAGTNDATLLVAFVNSDENIRRTGTTP